MLAGFRGVSWTLCCQISGELKKLFGFLRVARRSDLYIGKIGIPKQVVLELRKNNMCICNPKNMKEIIMSIDNYTIYMTCTE